MRWQCIAYLGSMPAGRKVKKKSAAPKAKKTATAAKKKAAAPAKAKAKKVVASKPKPKKKAAAAAPKPKPKPKKKAAAKAKTRTKAAPAPAAKAAKPAKKASRTPPPPRPSERAIATVSQVPTERPLTDEERDAMSNVAALAKRFLGVDGSPSEIARRIAGFVDEVRGGKPAPKSNDVRLGLGALWGEQVRAQVGWRWVHLTYKDLAFSSYALVPDDRAFACFPLNRVPDLMNGGVNTSLVLFEKIRVGDLPGRKANAYLVIG